MDIDLGKNLKVQEHKYLHKSLSKEIHAVYNKCRIDIGFCVLYSLIRSLNTWIGPNYISIRNEQPYLERGACCEVVYAKDLRSVPENTSVQDFDALKIKFVYNMRVEVYFGLGEGEEIICVPSIAFEDKLIFSMRMCDWDGTLGENSLYYFIGEKLFPKALGKLKRNQSAKAV